MKNKAIDLEQLLTDVIHNPQHYSSNHLVKSLKSQGGIAALSGEFLTSNQHTLLLKPVSLNTLKSHSELSFHNGFKEIDRLRKLALKACLLRSTSTSAKSKNTKSGLSSRINALEHELDLHRKSIVILLQALSSALNDFKNIRDASDSALREKRASDAEKTLHAIVRMNGIQSSRLKLEPVPYSPGSVVDIFRYRDAQE